jgi:hypothetical protein
METHCFQKKARISYGDSLVHLIAAASPEASWLETREDALLTMRIRDLIQRSIAKAMRPEG